MDIVNFRDFGGVSTESGGRIATGALFRCGQPGPLGTTPFESLERLDFAAVVDLRFPDEVRSAIFPWSETDRPARIEMEEAGRGDAPHHAFFTASLESVDDVHRLYSRFYAGLPADPRYRSLIRRAFEAFVLTDGAVLVHCSAGKDRTGFLSALLLRLLGAHGEDIMADYMQSDCSSAKAALRPEIERRFAAQGRALPRETILDAILGVAPAYLEASFAAILDEAGSMSAYLASIGAGDSMVADLQNRFLA